MLVSIKKNKELIGVTMLIFCILAFYNPVLAVVTPTNEFYVNDYANVLTQETEQYIIDTNINLNRQTKAQIVVVTVNNLEGKSIEEYSTELFRRFGIGDKEKNNGVLLLCSTGDRMFRIEVGYGLEGALPDGKTGRIQDEYVIPYLKNNNYDEGIKNGFSAVLEEICKEYSINMGSTIQQYKAKNGSNGINIKFGSVLFYIPAIIAIIIRGAIKDKKKKKTIGIMYVTITAILLVLIIPPLGLLFAIFSVIVNSYIIWGKGSIGVSNSGGRFSGTRDYSSRGPYRGGRGSSGGGGSSRRF